MARKREKLAPVRVLCIYIYILKKKLGREVVVSLWGLGEDGSHVRER